MNNFTTNTYQMKRDIVNFSNKLCNVNLQSKFQIQYINKEITFTQNIICKIKF